MLNILLATGGSESGRKSKLHPAASFLFDHLLVQWLSRGRWLFALAYKAPLRCSGRRSSYR